MSAVQEELNKAPPVVKVAMADGKRTVSTSSNANHDHGKGRDGVKSGQSGQEGQRKVTLGRGKSSGCGSSFKKPKLTLTKGQQQRK